MTERMESILKDADLEVDAEGRESLVKMADELLNECKHRKKKMEDEASKSSRPTPSPVDGQPAPVKEEKSNDTPATSNTVPFCGLKVSAKELIVRRKDMQFLKKQIDANSANEARKQELGAEQGDA